MTNLGEKLTDEEVAGIIFHEVSMMKYPQKYFLKSDII